MTPPQLVIIAGPNGSGKSTLTESGQIAAHGLSFPEHYVNADDIARSLSETEPSGSQEERERAAFLQARALRREYREQGVSFAFETVFSHPSTLLDIQKCRLAGYEVTLIYVTTAHADINVARVAGRVRQGKHAVPEDRIRDCYERSLSLLPRMVEDVPRAFVFDTTSERQMRLCFQKLAYETGLNPPPYLQTRLVQPLRQRRNDWDEILRRFGSVSLPDEEQGETRGQALSSLTSYLVQDVVGTLVRHDRLLINVAPPLGQVVTLRYREGSGTLSSD